ncbi:MAG: MmgE/PrpD family protein, partial [Pseudorhodoplanes sp.]
MSTITSAFAEFVSTLRLNAIPAEVRASCRLGVLDTIGAALAGSDAPGTGAVLSWCAAAGGAAQSTLIGHGIRLPAESAAMFNGTAASALDYDSYDAGKGYLHTDIVVIPAALAVAEAIDADGARLLEAIVAGTEVATRIAHTIGERKGWYLTSVLGPLGAAAASAKLMALPPAQVRHALGIAFAHSAGTHQSIMEQGLTKRLHAGLAARAGVTAAGLARHGITAPAEVIEGQYGFYRMYQDGDPDGITDGLGRQFSLAGKVFKKYPTCALTHAALDAAAALRRDHGLEAAKIGAVTVRITPYMERLVGGPFQPEDNPQVSAQFCLRYCVASMLIRGKLGFVELETPAVLDRGVR